MTMTTHARSATADGADKVEVDGTSDSLINSYTGTVSAVATTSGGESEEGGGPVEKNPLQRSSILAGPECDDDNDASETDCGMANTERATKGSSSAQFYTNPLTPRANSQHLRKATTETMTPRTSEYSGDSSTISTNGLLLDTSGKGSFISSISRDVKNSFEDVNVSTGFQERRSSSVLMSSKQLADQERIGELTMNRLRKTSLGLHGRDKELAQLSSCLAQVAARQKEGPQESKLRSNRQMYSASQRSLVLISGVSGAGKSALASSLRQEVSSAKYRGLFVSGKFDLHMRDEPYFGIAAACREICGAILMLRTNERAASSGSLRFDRTKSTQPTELTQFAVPNRCFRSFEAIRKKLVDKIGVVDLQLLTNVIPELSEIVVCNTADICEDQSQSTTAKTVTVNQQEAKAKLQYLFRIFIRLITSFFGTLVMTLDDLQWADPGSLELMKVLISDRDNPHLMIVGLYRSNEVNGTHILSKLLSELKESGTSERHMMKKSKQENNKDFTITEIEVGSLNIDAVKSVVRHLLSIDDDTSELDELAGICWKRTEGNAFFLISFIVMLEQEGFLTFDLLQHKFVWDAERIRSGTGASSNVVELVKRRMGKLTQAQRSFLSIAACTGAVFNAAKVRLVWKESHSEALSIGDTDDDVVSAGLDIAVQEGFIEEIDHGVTYRWVHDKVQEAGLALIDGDPGNFKFTVGKILYMRLSEEDRNASLFVITNLLNSGNDEMMPSGFGIEMAKLNLLSAQKAASMAAFSSALKFSSTGIDLLPCRSWDNFYRLSLGLYSCAAEAAELVGDYPFMQSCCDKVLTECHGPLMDKLRVYNVLSSYLSNSSQHAESVNLLLDVLHRLGCRFPRSSPYRMVATLTGLISTKMTLKTRSPEEILNMKILDDTHQLEVIKLLDRLATAAYLISSDICPLAIIRNIQLTLKYGLCDFSAPAFGTMALVITAVVGDFDGGRKIGEYALGLLEMLDSKVSHSRTKFVVNCFTFPWTKPLKNLLNPLREAYEDGLSNGDTESAAYAMVTHIVLDAISGRTLKQLIGDCHTYGKQMKELGRIQAFNYTLVHLQTCLNLVGLSEATTVVQGDAIPDIDGYLEQYPQNLILERSKVMRLCAIFADYEKGAKVCMKHGHTWAKAHPGYPVYMEALFCGGLCCFAIANELKQGKSRKSLRSSRRYRKFGERVLTTITSWVRKGNPNVKHHEALLLAEKAAICGKHRVAEQHFQAAISMAARIGFIHDAATSNERYGLFLLRFIKDREGGAFYLKRAIGYYADWGAVRKVRQLQQEHCDLWDAPPTKVVSLPSNYLASSNSFQTGSSDFLIDSYGP